MKRPKARRPGSLVYHTFWFNLLLVFVPTTGILFLDTYEAQLLQKLEQILVQQGRFAAAAMESLEGGLVVEGAQTYLGNLRQRLESRVRILDRQGRVLADSASVSTASTAAPVSKLSAEPYQGLTDRYTAVLRRLTPQDTFLYRLASSPVRAYRRYIRPRNTVPVEPDFDLGQSPEVTTALAGRYGASTRVVDPADPVLVLYSAIPILDPRLPADLPLADRVQGVVLVSQSTSRILLDLYNLRLDLLVFVIAGALAALGLSVLWAVVVLGPLRRLGAQARNLLDPLGRPRGVFPLHKGNNEVGQLARGLHDLSLQLLERNRYVDRLVGDILHEVKNPLASMRASLEILESMVPDPVARRFVAMLQEDVGRMRRMAEGLRVQVQADLGAEVPAGRDDVMDLGAVRELVEGLLDRQRLVHPGLVWSLDFPSGDYEGILALDRHRLGQVLDNLMENAAGFSPPGSPVIVSVLWDQEGLKVGIRDQGLGISPGDEERVFERFVSSRKHDGGHSGLGLSIVRSLVESVGGTCRFEAVEAPGALVVLWLPWVRVAGPAAKGSPRSSDQGGR